VKRENEISIVSSVIADIGARPKGSSASSAARVLVVSPSFRPGVTRLSRQFWRRINSDESILSKSNRRDSTLFN